jgi:hypothetical protein
LRNLQLGLCDFGGSNHLFDCLSLTFQHFLFETHQLTIFHICTFAAASLRVALLLRPIPRGYFRLLLFAQYINIFGGLFGRNLMKIEGVTHGNRPILPLAAAGMLLRAVDEWEKFIVNLEGLGAPENLFFLFLTAAPDTFAVLQRLEGGSATAGDMPAVLLSSVKALFYNAEAQPI